MEGKMTKQACSSKKAKQSSWQLVWISESAFKSQFSERRSAMSATAESLGGSLACLKSMDRYGRYLAENGRLPFVLVTGWREAKPCVQELQKLAIRPEMPRPSCVFVLPEPEQLFKATCWAASQWTEVPVRVVRDMGELGVGLTMRHALCNVQVLQQAIAPKMEPPSLKDAIFSGATLGRPCARKQSWADIIDNATDDCTSWVTDSPLASMMSSMDAEELARVLTAAMPDSYED